MAKSTPQTIVKELSLSLSQLKFSSPVAYVYNPLDYAWAAHQDYLQKYGQGKKRVILLGMNPGPWGMAQTGVPFGEVSFVKDWLKIEGEIKTPQEFHPKRPVEGWECSRSEVSGKRLWGWISEYFKQPQNFFKDYMVLNYCPLLFLEESGRNLTPDKIKAEERNPMLDICNQALKKLIDYYQPEWALGIGGFAEKRLQEVIEDPGIKIGTVLHPSPASPAANRGWSEQAEKKLRALGLLS